MSGLPSRISGRRPGADGSVKIVSNINVYSDWGAASALGVVLLFIIIAILWASRKLVQLVAKRVR